MIDSDIESQQELATREDKIKASYEEIMNSAMRPIDSNLSLSEKLEAYVQMLHDVENNELTQSKLDPEKQNKVREEVEEKIRQAKIDYRVKEPSRALQARIALSMVASTSIGGISIFQWEKDENDTYADGYIGTAAIAGAGTLGLAIWFYQACYDYHNASLDFEGDKYTKTTQLDEVMTSFKENKIREEIDRLKDNVASNHKETNHLRLPYWEKYFEDFTKNPVTNAQYHELSKEKKLDLLYVGVSLVSYYSSIKNNYQQVQETSEYLMKMVQELTGKDKDDLSVADLQAFDKKLPTLYAQMLYQNGRVINTKGFAGNEERCVERLEYSQNLRRAIDKHLKEHDNYNGENSMTGECLNDTVLFKRSGLLEYDFKKARNEQDSEKRTELFNDLAHRYNAIAEDSIDPLHQIRCKGNVVRIYNELAKESDLTEKINHDANQARNILFGGGKESNMDTMKKILDQPKHNDAYYTEFLSRGMANFIGILLRNHELKGSPVAMGVDGNPLELSDIEDMNSYLKSVAKNNGAEDECDINQATIDQIRTPTNSPEAVTIQHLFESVERWLGR